MGEIWLVTAPTGAWCQGEKLQTGAASQGPSAAELGLATKQQAQKNSTSWCCFVGLVPCLQAGHTQPGSTSALSPPTEVASVFLLTPQNCPQIFCSFTGWSYNWHAEPSFLAQTRVKHLGWNHHTQLCRLAKPPSQIGLCNTVDCWQNYGCFHFLH